MRLAQKNTNAECAFDAPLKIANDLFFIIIF